MAIKLILGGTNLLGKWGELDPASRQRDSFTDWSRGGGLTSKLLSVCLSDPKDLSGSPRAASEYIVVTDAQLYSHAPISFLPFHSFKE